MFYATCLFQVPTINQETAIANSEPTETLKKFRSDKVLRKKPQGTKVNQGNLDYNLEYNSISIITYWGCEHLNLQVYFGQNMVCSDSQIPGKGKMITVGNPVYVLKAFSSAADAAAWMLL